MRILIVVLAALGLVAGFWATAAHAAPVPSDLLLAAESQRTAGDYPAAVELYQQAFDGANADPEGVSRAVARSALYRMAQTYALDGHPQKALEAWTRFMQAYPDDARWSLAQLQLANALRDSKNLPAAFLVYQAY